MANRLEDLLIKEVSGVDDPANESPGWMVQKAAAAVPALDAPSAEEAEAVSTLTKVKEILLGKSNDERGKEDEVSVTKEELSKELDERFGALAEALVEKFAELTKAAEPEVTEPEAPAAPEAPAEPAAEAPAAPSLTADDVAKAIDEKFEALQAPILEILEKMIERQERVEDMLSIRKSIDGQEGEPAGEPRKPTLNDAMVAAFRGRQVELS